ncbi:MAG: aminodeoxychorismate synthase component I [Planctomyces sp.]|nr:aminodeoxychorismate synthase component I [Planctomyces sp.]
MHSLICEPLDPAPSVEDALSRFAGWRHPIVFHSALVRAPLGRHSFLSGDPLETHAVDAGNWDAVIARLRDRLRAGAVESATDDCPFPGGVAGLATYEAGRLWERLPETRFEAEWPFPLASLGLYDWAIAWDHATGECRLIVHPLSRSAAEVQARVRQIREALNGPPAGPWPTAGDRFDALSGVPGFPLDRLAGLESNFDRQAYIAAVKRTIRYITAGDIFQANLSQRLTIPWAGRPVDLFRTLCRVNPAPFAGYYDAGPWQAISASPERFLQLDGEEVETRPIKGTRARRSVPEADLFTRDELRESDKDRAENVMIVDLLRNDLSRVCRPGTIRVPQLCAVETYETVQHLVSEVRGRLQPGRDFFDLLATSFPGGSITGAPKIRAMEIISELEQVPRGPYCGSLFYVGFGGRADSNLLIRTFTRVGGRLLFPVGGGITAQSDPADEYEETLHKAEGLLRALEQCR